MTDDARLQELKLRWEMEPSSRVFVQLAEEHRRQGQLDEALAVVEAGLAKHPRYLAGRLVKGRCLLEAGRSVEAREVLEGVLEQDPTQVVAAKLLAECAIEQGDHAAAESLLERCAMLGVPEEEVEELRERMRMAGAPSADAHSTPPMAAEIEVAVAAPGASGDTAASAETPPGHEATVAPAEAPDVFRLPAPPPLVLATSHRRPARSFAGGEEPIAFATRLTGTVGDPIDNSLFRFPAAVASAAVALAEPTTLQEEAEPAFSPAADAEVEDLVDEPAAEAEESVDTEPTLDEEAEAPAAPALEAEAAPEPLIAEPDEEPAALVSEPDTAVVLPVLEEEAVTGAFEAAPGEQTAPDDRFAELAEVEERPAETREPAQLGAAGEPGPFVAEPAAFVVPPPEPLDIEDDAPLEVAAETPLALDGTPPAAAAPTASPTLAGLYLRQGHLDEAEAMARAVLASDPGNAEAERLLGVVAARRSPALTAEELLADRAPATGLTSRKIAMLKGYLGRLRQGGRA